MPRVDATSPWNCSGITSIIYRGSIKLNITKLLKYAVTNKHFRASKYKPHNESYLLYKRETYGSLEWASNIINSKYCSHDVRQEFYKWIGVKWGIEFKNEIDPVGCIEKGITNDREYSQPTQEFEQSQLQNTQNEFDCNGAFDLICSNCNSLTVKKRSGMSANRDIADLCKKQKYHNAKKFVNGFKQMLDFLKQSFVTVLSIYFYLNAEEFLSVIRNFMQSSRSNWLGVERECRKESPGLSIPIIMFVKDRCRMKVTSIFIED